MGTVILRRMRINNYGCLARINMRRNYLTKSFVWPKENADEFIYDTGYLEEILSRSKYLCLVFSVSALVFASIYIS